MRLLIIRHGIAEDIGPDGTDSGRRLTPEGVEKTRHIARSLVKLARKPDLILASPKIRADHTARIIAEAFDVKVQTLPILQEEDPVELITALAARKEETLAIVGHEPTLGALVELLISGRMQRGSTPLKKAGIACFDLTFSKSPSDFSAQLKWLLTPEILTLM
jgi:phosphohistidine phosphatase